MKIDRRIGRRGALVPVMVAVGMAAGAVTATPALASTPGTMTTHTLGGSPSTGIAAIVPSPTGDDWVIPDTGALTQSLDVLGASGVTSTVPISGTGIQTGGTIAATGDGVSAVEDGEHLLSLAGASDGDVEALSMSSPAFDPRGITIGPDGHIDVADNIDAIDDCAAVTQTCVTYRVPIAFAEGEPDGITSAGGLLWFTDDFGDLGSLNTTTGAFSSVEDAGDFFPASYGIVGDGSDVYVIAADQRQIDEVSSTAPSKIVAHPVTAAAQPAISSLTIGPDGNVWFTDPANDAVGDVNSVTGAVTEYPVPAGDTLSSFGAIVDGPAGTGTLVFPLTTASGADNVVGQVQSAASATTTPPTSPPSLPAPAPTTAPATAPPVTSAPAPPVITPGPTEQVPTLTVPGSAMVSRAGLVGLALQCTTSTAACRGQLILAVQAPGSGRRDPHGHVEPIGHVRYACGPRASATVRVQLSRTGERLLRAAQGHRLRVLVTTQPTDGRATSTRIELVAAHRR